MEERLAWLEKHVIEQDKAMLEISDELDRAKKQLQELRERLVTGSEGGAGDDLANEKPPHY